MSFRHTHILYASILGAALALTIAACDSVSVDPAAPGGQVDLEDLQNGDIIPGQYIVVLDEARVGKAPEAAVDDILRETKVEPIHRYRATVHGIAARMSVEQADELSRDDRVKYVEPDRVFILAPCKKFPDHPDCAVDGGDGGVVPPQETPWGITRVGGPGNGAGKTAWILDTGIDLDHPDLNVDASRGFNAFTSGKDGRSLDDGHGHGTHVAGTIAAIDNNQGVVGVAAGATVVPVKVLSSQGWGSWSGIIAGIDYVGANGQTGDVANMSLGGSGSQAVDDAVRAASNTVWFVLAAGNDGESANYHSPARTNGPRIYTISAINSGDFLASFSNYGNPPVDFAAPGVSVKSTWKNGGYNTISGTSMATPHVAGILLLHGSVATGGFALGDPDGNPDPIAHR